MHVYVSVDMEGIAGIATDAQVTKGQPDYPLAQALMTAEANAAIAGAFDGGATAVLVNDSHGDMVNLLADDLDERAELLLGEPKDGSMCAGLTRAHDLAVHVGYHSGPGVRTGVLGHTYAGSAFQDLRLNGETVTETVLNALYAAAHGVPVGVVTGDAVTCELAAKAIPGVRTVPVKRGLGVTAAASVHPRRARERIRAAVGAATAEAAALRPVDIPAALELEARFYTGNAAARAAWLPGSQRVDQWTVRRLAGDPRELLDVVCSWAVLGAVTRA